MLRPKTVVWAMCALTASVFAQTDPGVRSGPPAAGRPLPQLTPAENAAFQEGVRRFNEVASVNGTESGAASSGLGPRFNLNSCVGCHAHPAPGGSSPPVNPQVAVATAFRAQNTVPDFILLHGPVRSARFINYDDGTPDGSVHQLFVISGRSDAANCAIAQPDFATAAAQKNLALRIPTPLFGLGLMEAIPDGAILANMAANGAAKAALGIAGRPNRSGNDNTITRFGWKAQNKSLEIFAGEAYNVEIGITNELFPSENDVSPACLLNPLPEDQTNFTATTATSVVSDVVAFASFMRALAPPQPAQQNPSVQNGAQVFNQTGCALCHTPAMNTVNTTSASLNNREVHLFSDLLLHHMGSGLADGIAQGLAAGDEFRTAPLWGLGQRIFLLHDGRTTDLVNAIEQHSSAGSEANAVVAAFHALPPNAVQDLLNFLRSL